MCGRYVIKTKIEAIEKRFNVKAPPGAELQANFNVSPGDLAPVIASDHPNLLQLFRFGLCPSWAAKPMYLLNARSEGDKNKADDPNYSGAKDIVNKPAFRKSIRSKRCLVLADAFIEGTIKEKLDKPFAVYLTEKAKTPFAFAGLWDEWVNVQTGEIVKSFAIITTTPNAILRALPHHRSPVILNSPEEERAWLDVSLPLADVLGMLRPYPDAGMNAYPISPEIKNPKRKEKALLMPVGERIVPETEYQFNQITELQGMGMTSARRRKLEERKK